MPKVEGIQKEPDGRPYWEHPDCRVVDEEAKFLFGLTVSLRPKIIAEVGTGEMGSLSAFVTASEYMSERLKWQSEIYTCDVNESRIKAAREKFQSVKSIQGPASELVAKIDGKIDLGFIDGWHSYEAAKYDFDCLSEISSDRCVFVFHDAQEHGVARVIRELGGIIILTPRGIGIVAK